MITKHVISWKNQKTTKGDRLTLSRLLKVKVHVSSIVQVDSFVCSAAANIAGVTGVDSGVGSSVMLPAVLRNALLQNCKDLPLTGWLYHVLNSSGKVFWQTFIPLQELPKFLEDLASTDADLPWNRSKNRFPNIKPCMCVYWPTLPFCSLLSDICVTDIWNASVSLFDLSLK